MQFLSPERIDFKSLITDLFTGILEAKEKKAIAAVTVEDILGVL